MDRISTSQLHHYDGLFDEMSSEYEKGKELEKEVKMLDNSIIALKLSLSDYNQKISHTKVKIFNNIWEIYNLYESEVKLLEVPPPESYKCYLVEVFLTKFLLEKLIEAEWKLQISVCCDDFAVNKVVNLENKTPILEILPVPDDIEECTVQSSLFLHSYDSCHIIDLDCVDIDISYHFQEAPNKQKQNSINKLTALYRGFKFDNLQPQLQSQIKLNNFDKSRFVTTILKNSYHKLDPDMFADYDNQRSLEVAFYIGSNQIILSYNNDTDILKIKCSSEIMLNLKKFFLKYCSCDQVNVKRKSAIVAEDSNVDSMDYDDLLELYHDIRKL